MTPAIPTDLVTPLGAYLRLRGPGRASFLLESVDQGRLGRYSLIGSGTRIVDIHEAERLNEPVVGHVGYDWITELEPTVPLPAAGRGLPVSQFVVADRLVRFDHVKGVAEVLIRLATARPRLDVRILCWQSALPVAATQKFFPIADRGVFGSV